MRNSKEHLIERTLRVWQPLAPKPLTTEDALDIIENIASFFQILKEWQSADQEASSRNDSEATDSFIQRRWSE